jgi:hypothetical protein
VGTADVLTDPLGTGRAKPTEGALRGKPLPPPMGPLGFEAVSEIEIVGMAGPGVDWVRDGGWTFSVGIDGSAHLTGAFDLRACITLGSGLGTVSS